MTDTYSRLRRHLARAHNELPDGWHVALVAVMPHATTRAGVLLITDDLEAIKPALSDALAGQEGMMEVPH